MSQKYVIVHFIDKEKCPHEFLASEWPLHITLLANFTISKSLEAFQSELAKYSRKMHQFTVSTNGEALFGPNRNIAVSLMNPDSKLQDIHAGLASITSSFGAVYDEPHYMGEGFRPHATIQANSRLTAGQKVLINSFSLVDMFPEQDIARRRIIRTYKLIA